MTPISRGVVALLAGGLAASALAAPSPVVASSGVDRTDRADRIATRAAANPARAVYVTGDSNDKVAAHRIGATGGLTPVGLARDAADSPEGIELSPDGKHAYMALYGSDQILHVPVNADGSLGTPDLPVAAGNSPYALSVTPNGKFLFSADYTGSTISRFRINANGSLTSLGLPLVTPTAPYPIVVSSNGKYLFYGYTALATAAISATGALTPVGTTVATNVVNSYDLTLSPDNKFLYSIDGGNNTVAAYSIASNGQLAAVGTPAALPPGSGVNGATMTPGGTFIYTANYNAESISVFAVAGSSITAVGTPVPMTGKGPANMVVTPDGKTLYVGNYTSDDISQFTIAAGGTLTEAAGSPFAAGVVNPDYFAITTTPNQGPTAKITKVKKSKAVVGKKLTLKAGASKDPDGSIVRYVWKVGGKTKTTTKPKLKVTFKKAKKYKVTLTVIDNENCSVIDVSTGHTLHCNGNPRAFTKIKVKVVKPKN